MMHQDTDDSADASVDLSALPEATVAVPQWRVRALDKLRSFANLSVEPNTAHGVYRILATGEDYGDDKEQDHDPDRHPDSVWHRSVIWLQSHMTTLMGCIIVILVLVILVMSMSRERLLPLKMNSPPRKALVLAGLKEERDYSWFDDVPSDWDILHYIEDDPLAEYWTPSSHGREGMAYLTYIIEHYDNLHDFIVFGHGHGQQWHQIEPMPYILEALNLDLVRKLSWANLRCQTQLHLFPPTNDPGPLHKYPYQGAAFRGLWSFIFRPNDTWYMPLPEEVVVTCCAQFVTTKQAILRQPLDFWKRARIPMMRSMSEPFFKAWDAGIDEWRLGFTYERMWHILLGMPPINNVSNEFCHDQLFSDRIHCDGETTDYQHSRNWASINCTLDEPAPQS